MSQSPIGVFDSGVGGLSVLRAIHAQLPHEALHYVADSGHAPYGDKSPAFIQERAEKVVGFLQSKGVKAVVVACNTVTGLSISQLRERFPALPVVAIEPAVKPAVAQTRSGTVGVLATRNTVASLGLARLIEQHAQGVKVLAQACPGWVEFVERGKWDTPEALLAVRQQVQPLLDQGADVLALGCTHYPFLRAAIEAVAGPGVQIIDPAPAVARELARRIHAEQLFTSTSLSAPSPQVYFWTTAPVESVQPVIQRLWPNPSIDCDSQPTPASTHLRLANI
jgi:glutamate racemase